MLSSRGVGWREPSPAEKVPAPQGEPPWTSSRFASWAASMLVNHESKLCKDSKHTESSLVTQGYVDESVVHKRAHASNGRALLTSTEGAGGDEETSILAPEGTLLPLLASHIPKCLELCGKISISSS